jgi:hypothetical protein
MRLPWVFDRWDRGDRFSDRLVRVQELRALVAWAQTAAARCRINDAVRTLEFVNPSRYIVDPEAIDFEIIIDKLVRRLTLFDRLPGDVMSNEFCRP